MTFQQAINKVVIDGMRVARKRMEIQFVGKFPCIELSNEWGYDSDLGLLHIPCNYAEVVYPSGLAMAVTETQGLLSGKKLDPDYSKPKCKLCQWFPTEEIIKKVKFLRNKS